MSTSDSQREENRTLLRKFFTAVLYTLIFPFFAYIIVSITYLSIRKFSNFDPHLDDNRFYRADFPEIALGHSLWDAKLLPLSITLIVAAYIVAFGITWLLVSLVDKFSVPSDIFRRRVNAIAICATLYTGSALIIRAHTDHSWANSFLWPIFVMIFGAAFAAAPSKKN